MAEYRVPAWSVLACGLFAGTLTYRLASQPKLDVQPTARTAKTESPERIVKLARGPAILIYQDDGSQPSELILAAWEDGHIVWRDLNRSSGRYFESYISPARVRSAARFYEGEPSSRDHDIREGFAMRHIVVHSGEYRTEFTHYTGGCFILDADLAELHMMQLVPAKGSPIAAPVVNDLLMLADLMS